MLKHHNYISIIIGVLYLITLQVFASPEPTFRFLLPALLVFSLAASYYNYHYLKAQQKYNLWVIIRQVLLFFSGFCLFLLLPNTTLRGLFLIPTAALIALFEYTLATFAENILINETLIIAFGFFVGIFGAGHYISWFFKTYLGTFYIAAIFTATLLTSRAFFEFIPQSSRVKLLNSVALALFCTEMFWALTFLPFHFSAMGILLFNVFYFCLILDYYYLFQTLNLKKIKFHLTLILICSGLVLFLTPWKIIN